MNGDAKRQRLFRARCYEAQEGKCHWCGGQMTTNKPAKDVTPHPYYHTVEHLIPSFEGGSGRVENLRVACLFCNDLYNYVWTVVLKELRKLPQANGGTL